MIRWFAGLAVGLAVAMGPSAATAEEPPAWCLWCERPPLGQVPVTRCTLCPDAQPQPYTAPPVLRPDPAPLPSGQLRADPLPIPSGQLR